MYRRPPGYSLSHRGPEYDLRQAHAVIQRLAQERDALAEMVQEARSVVDSLKRQLEARERENAHLTQALRVRKSQGDSQRSASEMRRLTVERDEALAERERLARRVGTMETLIGRVEAERDEAIAERDSASAAQRHAEAALEELRGQLPDAARVQRLAADLANVRRQRDAQIARGVRSETHRLLSEIASVRDSVTRALQDMRDAASPWRVGLERVLGQIDAVLSSEGASVIGERGELFDPKVHEAVALSEAGDAGRVVDVIGCGIVSRDGSVVRPARVVVSS